MAYIIKPIVTEKMNTVSEKQNKFGFIVRPEANKLEIKAEVEALYGVTVVDDIHYIARGYEDIIAAITLVALLFLAYPVVLLLIFVIIRWKHKNWTAKGICLYLQDKGERKMEDIREKRIRRKHHKERFDEEEDLL